MDYDLSRHWRLVLSREHLGVEALYCLVVVRT